jgi:ferredoxin
VSIQAEDGALEKSDYEDRILEALRQSGINIIFEDKG